MRKGASFWGELLWNRADEAGQMAGLRHAVSLQVCVGWRHDDTVMKAGRARPVTGSPLYAALRGHLSYAADSCAKWRIGQKGVAGAK